MAKIAPQPRLQFLDSNGEPLSGGKLYTYVSGASTTPLASYTDASENTANANPVILDASGSADVWIKTDSTYRFVLDNASDVNIFTVDDISVTTFNATLTSNLDTNGFTITSNGDQNITISPAGTGKTLIDDLQLTSDIDLNTYDVTDSGGDVTVTHGASNKLLVANSSGVGKIAVKSDNANSVTIQAPASLGSSVAFTLPSTDGSAGSPLITNGSNVLSFGDSPGLVKIDTQSFSASAEIEFTTGIDTTYDLFMIVGTDIHESNAHELNLEVSTDGGSTWKTGASDYGWRMSTLGSSYSSTADTADAHIQLGANFQDSANPAQMTIWIQQPGDSGNYTTLMSQANDGTDLIMSSGAYLANTAVDGIKILVGTASTLASGTFVLYGLKK